MKILVVGGGGREHAICYKIAQSEKCEKLYCAPGNAGIAEYAECVNIGVMEFDKMVAFAKDNQIDLVVVGPDDPLVGGIVDAFEAAGIKTFGPRKNAAILEGSKAFSKELMKKYNIPTAAYETFEDADAAMEYLKTAKMPIVLKADGLALGKGVLICNTREEAMDGVKEIMLDKHFGSAGNKMVVEEFMTGREVSVLCFCDGTKVVPMTSAQDHKRAGDGDTGLNTGGMGTFSPSPFYTEEVDAFCKKYIYQCTMDAMKAEEYRWWLARLRAAAKMYDMVRIDHFRGFESYWSVPYGAPNARNGKWVTGPGLEFIQILRKKLRGLSFIAEDLGFLTPEVIALREASGFPGMKVLEFAFDPREPSDYLPHNYERHCVCYTGTHDNATVMQWYAELPKKHRDFAKRYLTLTKREGIHWGVIRGGMSSTADLFIAQMQDYLALPACARMNEPGHINDRNWRWRMLPDAITPALVKRIRELTERYCRIPIS